MADTTHATPLAYPCWSFCLMSQAPAGHPSDVPARLLRACDTADAAAAAEAAAAAAEAAADLQLALPQSGSSGSIEAPADDL